MGKSKKGSSSSPRSGDKRKREPTPPSEDFGDSVYLEEEFSSESEGSPAPASQGIAVEVWTYIRAVERAGLEGSDESEYSSDEEDSSDSSEEGSSGDGGDSNDDGSDGDGGDDSGKGGDGSSEGGNGSSEGGHDSGKGSNQASG
jgi:hypothetical protein